MVADPGWDWQDPGLTLEVKPDPDPTPKQPNQT